MSNILGKNITLTLFGESHGEMIGAVLDGIAPGLRVDADYINSVMALRKPEDGIGTNRREADEVEIISGVNSGFSTGDSITIIIKNTDVVPSGSDNSRIPRPGHADYTQVIRSHGYGDVDGGGHLSGRLTAPIVAAGAIVLSALSAKGIDIVTNIDSIAGIKNVSEDIMRKAILSAKENGDSVGGILRTEISGLPAGIGEPFFDSMESLISHAVFSVPAVKGIEFGMGFAMAEKLGSEANDSFALSGDKIETKTNNNGGINGGITNGMPIIFRTAIKPTPSISKVQSTIDIKSKENVELCVDGRHDPCIAARAGIVITAVTALAVADALTSRYGTEYFAGENI